MGAGEDGTARPGASPSLSAGRVDPPLRLVLQPAIAHAAIGAIALTLDLPASGPVELTAHDLLGRRIATLADGWMPAGRQIRTWSPRGVTAGVYFLRLRAGGEVRSARLLRID